MPQTTSCCLETAQALEEKYTAKSAVLRKFMEQTMLLMLKTSFLFSVLLLSSWRQLCICLCLARHLQLLARPHSAVSLTEESWSCSASLIPVKSFHKSAISWRSTSPKHNQLYQIVSITKFGLGRVKNVFLPDVALVFQKQPQQATAFASSFWNSIKVQTLHCVPLVTSSCVFVPSSAAVMQSCRLLVAE